MAEGQVSDKHLTEALLRERDELYRRATKAEHRLAELSDAEAMRQQYEARIKEMEADHQKEISKKEADFQKEFSKKEDEYKKVLSKKEDEIRSLVARIEYMARIRKWLNDFFTHIHDYDEDYSRDLLELLPHNLKQKGIL